MPEPIPDVDVRIAIFATFEHARVILWALQRAQKQCEANPFIEDLMRPQPIATSEGPHGASAHEGNYDS